jgi:cytochrome c peroxidase
MVVLIVVSFAVCTYMSFRGQAPANKSELGKLLFFDTILSKDKTVSCATCHKPAFAFADTTAVSLGIGSRAGVRNTPSAMNLLLQKNFFWDGRAATLEEQALAPIADPSEMGLPVAEAVQRLKEDPGYREYFNNIFGSDPSKETLAAALAAFERTLETSESPFDNWKFFDDSNAVDLAVKKGFELFNGKGKCVQCHFGSNLTTNEFRNIGLFNAKQFNDSGRAKITGQAEDLGKFKTPALRNISVTAPYMHNGMFRTLSEVITFYDDPSRIVPDAINRDSILSKPLGLSPLEKEQLEAFLLSLTDSRFKTPARQK